MKKPFLILAILLVMPLLATAQTYSRLWKDYEAAVSGDLPKTAVSVLDKVRAKALAEGNDGQLLRAVLLRLQQTSELSPDSLTAGLERLDSAATAERRPVVRSLWFATAGLVRLQQWGDTASQSRGRVMILEALSDLPALADARTADYLPLFEQGTDSRYYDDDVLSAILHPVVERRSLPNADLRRLCGEAAALYLSRGNRNAALLVRLDSISTLENAARRAALVRTAGEYAGVPLNVETYIALADVAGDGLTGAAADSAVIATARRGISLYGSEKRAAELRNLVTRMTLPTISARVDESAFYPGERVTLPLHSRNVRRATLEVSRLDCTAADARLRSGRADRVKNIARKVVKTVSATLPEADDYKWTDDSIAFSLDETGIYRLRLLADGRETDHAVVYVTRLLPVMYSVGGDTCYVRLVDSKSGRPLSGGRLRAMNAPGGVWTQKAAYDPVESGEFVVRQTGRDYSVTYFATLGDDAYSPGFTLNTSGRFRAGSEREQTHVSLYTDRGIYRPGQCVDFGGIAYLQQGDSVRAYYGLTTDVVLRDANYREVARLTCHTDSFGNLSGRFTLPAACLPGTFSLSASRGGGASFRVEEYKRPTFTATLTPPATAFRGGDTITISGLAETFTGVPVVGATVKYAVKGYVYRFRSASDDEPFETSGTVTTDSLGRFSFPLALANDDEGGGLWCPGRSYSVSADVTALNGETATASTFVRTSRRASWLSADWPATLCREEGARVTISHTGSNGQDLADSVGVVIKSRGEVVHRFTAAAGRAFRLALPEAVVSGEYAVEVTAADADTLRLGFLYFSMSDVRPVGTSPLWTHVRRSERGDTLDVLVGTPLRDAAIFYALSSGGRRLESRVFAVSDTLLRLPFTFREEWGDAARINFFMVRDGQTYSFSEDITRPVPDKRLVLSWKTFRSRLIPGTEETWSLHIAHPDGRPAEATLMARLYDASLDAFVQSPWSFSLSFPRRTTWEQFRAATTYALHLGGSAPVKYATVPSLDFTELDPALIADSYIYRALSGRINGIRLARSKQYALLDVVTTESTDEVAVADAPLAAFAAKNTSAAMENSAYAGSSAEEEKPVTAARTNFAETAFFGPAVRSNADGTTNLTFTLPQSTTTWRFTALAHTRHMDYGTLDTTVVARKEFMITPALPRFVRRGDRVSLPATLTNLTAAAVSGTVFLEVEDGETGARLLSQKQRFNVGGNGTSVVTFSLDAAFEQPYVVVRMTAEGKTFGDGEEHFLPVLSDRVTVARSVPFSMTGAGTLTLRTDTLLPREKTAADRRLVVDVTSNPTWYAVAALPPLANQTDESATGWATRYYADVMAEAVARYNPDVKRLVADTAAAWKSPLLENADLRLTLLAETPWMADAESETQRAAALRDLFDAPKVAAAKATALARLRDLQQADGSWSWFPGMQGNAYVTADVAVLLARLASLCGDDGADGLLASAMTYLEKSVKKDVAEMRRHPSTTFLDETHLLYLYARALRGDRATSADKYLIRRGLDCMAHASMKRKALFAVVLQRNGYDKETAALLRSLSEHAVETPAMGRYFDADRDDWCWRSNRIATQTAAIEALTLTADAERHAEADRMRLWLMQTKRTCLWQTGRATADAVYALLVAPPTSSVLMPLDAPASPLLYTLRRGSEVVAFNAPSEAADAPTLGRYHDVYTEGSALEADEIAVRKTTDGLSWGSVTATFTLPLTEVKSEAAGLSLSRRTEILKNGRWEALAEGERVKVGDRLRTVLTLRADRAFSFVSLRCPRAANAAVRNALSGFTWTEAGGCYRAVRDASTEFFFETLAKGSHTLTEEYVIDRAGRCTAGVPQAQCLYAPEFSATAPALWSVSE